MFPAVPLPDGSNVRTPVEIRLKKGWRFDAKRRAFVSPSGERFEPWADLPKRSRIVYTVPALQEANEARLSRPERELRQSMHLILPQGSDPAAFVKMVRAWPAVETAGAGPVVSLPRSPAR